MNTVPLKIQKVTLVFCLAPPKGKEISEISPQAIHVFVRETLPYQDNIASFFLIGAEVTHTQKWEISLTFSDTEAASSHNFNNIKKTVQTLWLGIFGCT